MKSYVLGFYYKTQHIVLIQKEKPVWQRGLFNAPGGHIEPGETPLVAIRREFKEETGIDVVPERWEHFCSLSGTGFELFCFRADAGSSDPPANTMTSEKVGIHRRADLPMTVPNLLWLIEMGHGEARRDWPYTIYESDAVPF